MVRSIKKLLGYRIEATDGEIGKVKDFYFDDHAWITRYLVADTGKWLVERKVLISPDSLGEPQWTRRQFPVTLTKEQVKGSPKIGTNEPVSRQHEVALVGYYNWTGYWGAAAYGGRMLPADLRRKSEGDPYLRSVEEVSGYRIHASDGEIGHVDDFLVDTDGWNIRYVIVDTRNWLPGRRVLVSPEWIADIDWALRKVEVSLAREVLRNSPEFNPDVPVNREYEAILYDYYGRPHYWKAGL